MLYYMIRYHRHGGLMRTCRKYPEKKLQENMDSEIMDVLLQEARDSYDENIIVELTSNTTDEMESNVDRVETWLKQWKKDNPHDGTD